MSNFYFKFKQFTVQQDRCAMKVTTDACLFGAWAAGKVGSWQSSVLSRQSSGNNWQPAADSHREDSQDRELPGILEIGTGTGVLSLMIAQKANAIIDTIEIDKDAFEQARENFLSSNFNNRLNIFHADARSISTTQKYEVIVSNPPFYENELKSPDEKKNLAHHAGLSLHELLQIIREKLHPSGQFLLLLPYRRINETTTLVAKSQLRIAEMVMIKQTSLHEPFRVFILGEHQKNDESGYKTSELTIRNEKQEYTQDFIELLRDYYLYL